MKPYCFILGATLLTMPLTLFADGGDSGGTGNSGDPIIGQSNGLGVGRPKSLSNVYIYVDYFGGCMSITSEADLGLLDVTLTSNTTAQTWHYAAVTLGTPVLMQLPDDSYTLIVESDSWTFTCYDFCVD